MGVGGGGGGGGGGGWGGGGMLFGVDVLCVKMKGYMFVVKEGGG